MGPRTAGIGEYIKHAFLFRWNLLAFGGGVAAAVLSPWPDAALALIAAGELVYITGLISSNKFRSAIDAQLHKEGATTAATAQQKSVQDLVAGLSRPSQVRFEALRARCLEMRSIAHGVRGKAAGQSTDDLNTSALDRLLWVFLRLLVSQEALQRFLDRTDIGEIKARIEQARVKLETYKDGDERILRSLNDSVAVQEMRLDNYEKARQNTEYVRIELDRIEAKIQAIIESSVNRQDPNFLTSQIDSVSETMQTTEKAISELQHITGIVDQIQEPPAILDAGAIKVTQR